MNQTGQSIFRRLISAYMIVAIGLLGMVQSVQAAMIGNGQVLVSNVERERISSFLARADVAARLEGFGLSLQDAQVRVAALSDTEVAYLAENIDEAPAGGIVDTLVFLFLVLLFTDIMGFTKVFPFTRPIR